MRIKDLLQKSPLELTDEELRYIGGYFLKYPNKLKPKEKVVLHKCYECKHLIWWDDLGWVIWKCLKTDKEMTTKMITHKRKCNLFDKDKMFGTEFEDRINKNKNYK